jgi:hypothetical protein
MRFNLRHVSLAVCIALVLAPVRAVAQQIARFLGESPIYLLPDAGRQPLLVASTGSTAEIIASDGAWLRVSMADAQGRKRVGYVQAKLVRVSEGEKTAAPPPARDSSSNRPAPASAPRKGPLVLDVTIVDRKSGDRLYTYVSPATASSASTSSASGTKTAFRPGLEHRYQVTGTTFTLKLPDGRHLVVNCDSKDAFTRADTKRRSCRTPLADQVKAQIEGDDAKLIWPISTDGKKNESETYRVLAILGDPK